jgi:5-methylcytosine-specific restriction endonuclease McrA
MAKSPRKTTARPSSPEPPRWSRGRCPHSTRIAVIRRDGACVYCLAMQDLTVDHIVPVSERIDHRTSNLVAACFACNRDRGVVDCDLFCRHMSRRTLEPWTRIYARVRASLATPIQE